MNQYDEIIDPLGVQSRFTKKSGQDFLKPAISARRYGALAAALILAFGAVGARSAYLQIARGDQFRAASEGNRVRRIPIFPLRGLVTDRYGTELVRNVPRFSVTLIPAYLTHEAPRRWEILQTLAALAGTTTEELAAFVQNRAWRPGEAILIADHLLQDDAVRLGVSVFDSGVMVEARSVREYRRDVGESLAHALGYMGRVTEEEYDRLASSGYVRSDVIGRTGLEKSYEARLRGKMGVRQIEVDARGIVQRVVAQTEPEDGQPLELALDLFAQKKLEEALRRGLKSVSRKRGAAIALDPRDGSVVALVSLPGFDPNPFVSGIDQKAYAELTGNKDRPLFPRAVSGEYPSGSIIKPIFAAFGLEIGAINPKTTVHSVGGIKVADSFFPDWQAGGHGTVDVMGAIANSVNTFFYYLGGGYGDFVGMGPDRLAEGGARFGLGAETGIDLPGEASGLLPTPEWKQRVKSEEWYIGDTYHFAIGQGDVLVTPIQMAAAIGAIANGGTLYAPHLISSDPSRVKRSDPVVSEETLRTIRRAMRATVTVGTAKMLQDVPVPVAGKTGTAEWGRGKTPHAWFVGFAPYENPEIVIVVLLEESGEGSPVAVPVAREFLHWYFGPHNKTADPRS